MSCPFLFGLICLFFYSGCHALNQLSFSGGGSFGAVEIGILKRLVELEPKKYDIYTGISAGALNAAFLSYYDDITAGVLKGEDIYSSLSTRMIYDILPTTGVSLFNTMPLHKTLSGIISRMPNKPLIHTLIGATNLYSGNLDIYNFEDNDDYNKVLLMMSSSAIPGLFPPIEYNGQLYADGGTLSNELLQVENRYQNRYLNITFITPYEGYLYNNDPIVCLADMLKRTVSIILSNYNNPLATMNQNCGLQIGEINKYFVSSKYLEGYNIMNFDKGSQLIDIGYTNLQHKKYKIC
jgi:patatin-like phospholipase/acyl hydrolase